LKSWKKEESRMAKIAVSSTGGNLEAQVDPRFGRCAYFIFVDTDTMEYEAVQNSNVSAASGAGIQTAQLVANKEVEAVLTGNVGPNAFQTLQAAGVNVIAGVTGMVKDAVQMYKDGKAQATGGPNVASHFGMSGGSGTSGAAGPGMGTGVNPGMGRTPGMGMGGGMGAGMGRGMGGGAGKGMGMGAGMGGGMMGPQTFAQQPFAGQPLPMPDPSLELPFLKQQADYLKTQLDEITKRIESLEKGSEK
jgi:predicted Fe-Mo cluster-binding NifX family protein